MEEIDTITRLVEPTASALGYELVRVQFNGAPGSGGGRILQIMIERQDRRGMTVDDCALVSREVSAVLDAADPVTGTYQLEISSPGIDRPLVKRADYERFAGHEARIETAVAQSGRKRFHGVIAGVEADAVRLEVEDGEVRLPLPDIRKAKLVLTDRLVRMSADADDAEGLDATEGLNAGGPDGSADRLRSDRARRDRGKSHRD